MTHYDLIVIGAGSGNTVVTKRFAGWRVAIIEHGLFGGTCLNVGCIPTKMFVLPADVSREAADGPRLGARTQSSGADWAQIRDRIFGRIDPIAASGKDYREGLANVDVYDGLARFTGPRTIQTGVGTHHDDLEITADQIVLAVGSAARWPDVPGLDEVGAHTSDTIMRLEELPPRLGIIGGGYIAAEFAHVFSGYGSLVTQVQRIGRLLSHLDEDISARYTEIAAQQWQVRLDTTVTRASLCPSGIRLELSDGSEVEVDAVLVATGRDPRTDDLGLDAAGVEREDDGRIAVDAFQRTSADGVWALGDCCSAYALKHVANHEARIVQHNLLHPDDLIEADHRFVPSAVFTSPQFAGVGLTEAEARATGIDLAIATHDYGEVAYGWALEDEQHFVKLLADRATGRLVGAHLLGPQASSLIQPLIQAMSFEQPVAGLARGQYWIHPALTEVVENALLKLEDALAAPVI